MTASSLPWLSGVRVGREGYQRHADGRHGYHVATMRIAMIASECEPWAKTGGLADVVDALSAQVERSDGGRHDD